MHNAFANLFIHNAFANLFVSFASSTTFSRATNGLRKKSEKLNLKKFFFSNFGSSNPSQTLFIYEDENKIVIFILEGNVLNI